jgi:hypothetical protein
MINTTRIADLCSSLEQWGQSDLNLLNEFGAAGFSTPHLYHLRVELTDKLIMSERRYNFLFLALFCSFGWALFGTGLMVIGFDKLAYPVFGLFTICTGIAITGILVLNKSVNNTARLSQALEVIYAELRSRNEVVVENEY